LKSFSRDALCLSRGLRPMPAFERPLPDCTQTHAQRFVKLE